MKASNINSDKYCTTYRKKSPTGPSPRRLIPGSSCVKCFSVDSDLSQQTTSCQQTSLHTLQQHDILQPAKKHFQWVTQLQGVQVWYEGTHTDLSATQISIHYFDGDHLPEHGRLPDLYSRAGKHSLTYCLTLRSTVIASR